MGMSAPSPFDSLVGTTLGNYHCQELLERSDLGPLYLVVSSSAPDSTYRLRVLPVRTDLPMGAQAAFLGQFLRQADHIATLQHAHLLPLVDFGHAGGLPYLVYPAVSLRSLTGQLAQHGPLDPTSAGLYLDQIATALAYAHDRATLHRRLSTDNIHLQQDGSIVVADFGVRRMIELSESEGELNPLRFSIETAAPEQLTGRPVERATDVYALGAVLYRLLTGSQVFTGRTREEIARQHVYSAVPSLSHARPDLPPMLDSILATAMAKNPEQRYPRPEMLVSAYFQAVAPAHQGLAAPPSRPVGQRGDQHGDKNRLATGATTAGPRAASSRPSSGMDRSSNPPAVQTSQNGAPGHAQRARDYALPQRPRDRRSRNWLLVATAATVIAVVLGTLFLVQGATPGGGPASARILFADSSGAAPGSSDALQVTASNLAAPPAGSQYDVWLINSQTELVVSLGVLSRHGSTYTLSYTGRAGAALPNANLLAIGDTFEITLEHGSVSVPSGTVMVRGHFPAIAYVHIQHILVSFPTTPGKIGLLVGVLLQTRLLAPHAVALRAAAQAHNAAQVTCEAHALLNILEGTQGQHYQPISPACVASDTSPQGDGFGLLGSQGTAASYDSNTGYISEATEHASLAATQPDSTADMHNHLTPLITSLNNVRTWEATLDSETAALLANPADTRNVQDIVTLAQRSYSGSDADHNGTIAPVAGEAGAITAYQQGQLMATLALAPGA